MLDSQRHMFKGDNEYCGQCPHKRESWVHLDSEQGRQYEASRQRVEDRRRSAIPVCDVLPGCFTFVEDDEEVFVLEGWSSSKSSLFPLLIGDWKKPSYRHIGEEQALWSVHIDGGDTQRVPLASAHDLLLEQAHVIGATRIAYRQRWEESVIDRYTPEGVHETGVYLHAIVTLARKRQATT